MINKKTYGQLNPGDRFQFLGDNITYVKFQYDYYIKEDNILESPDGRQIFVEEPIKGYSSYEVKMSYKEELLNKSPKNNPLMEFLT